MTYNLEKFLKGLEELQIELSDNQIQQFIRYYEMLVEKNKVMNLTAITEFDEVIEKHFLDSLSLIKVYDLKKEVSVVSSARNRLISSPSSTRSEPSHFFPFKVMFFFRIIL